VENENQFNNEEIYSKKVRAGKRRTYFFDVRTTRSNDYYITITESKRRFEGDGYERHKIHLYKEDFNKFLEAFEDTVQHIKTELMPDYDYDEFSKDENYIPNNMNVENKSELNAESSIEEPETDSVESDSAENESVENESDDDSDEAWTD